MEVEFDRVDVRSDVPPGGIVWLADEKGNGAGGQEHCAWGDVSEEQGEGGAVPELGGVSRKCFIGRDESITKAGQEPMRPGREIPPLSGIGQTAVVEDRVANPQGFRAWRALSEAKLTRQHHDDFQNSRFLGGVGTEGEGRNTEAAKEPDWAEGITWKMLEEELERMPSYDADPQSSAGEDGFTPVKSRASARRSGQTGAEASSSGLESNRFNALVDEHDAVEEEPKTGDSWDGSQEKIKVRIPPEQRGSPEVVLLSSVEPDQRVQGRNIMKDLEEVVELCSRVVEEAAEVVEGEEDMMVDMYNDHVATVNLTEDMEAIENGKESSDRFDNKTPHEQVFTGWLSRLNPAYVEPEGPAVVAPANFGFSFKTDDEEDRKMSPEDNAEVQSLRQRLGRAPKMRERGAGLLEVKGRIILPILRPKARRYYRRGPPPYEFVRAWWENPRLGALDANRDKMSEGHIRIAGGLEEKSLDRKIRDDSLGQIRELSSMIGQKGGAVLLIHESLEVINSGVSGTGRLAWATVK
ncbi:hypothetical protein R1sor_026344 [Riccia sorocarpa]|uniref:Uncharacterized protein n=1 Tax=Riccia sorocarpa TaxID=122646 RepID=A0ABD3GCR9_9MARC